MRKRKTNLAAAVANVPRVMPSDRELEVKGNLALLAIFLAIPFIASAYASLWGYAWRLL